MTISRVAVCLVATLVSVSVAAGAVRTGRSNLDGSEVEELTSSDGEPRGIAVDPAGGKYYWIVPGSQNCAPDTTIRRANLDGTAAEEILTGLTAGADVALDLINARIYWSETPDCGGSEPVALYARANLDGTGREDLFTAWPSSALEIDPAEGKLYVITIDDEGFNSARRINVDGTDPEFVGGGLLLRGLALDLQGGKVYWSGESTLVGGLRHIFRADLDGSNDEVVLQLPLGKLERALALGDGEIFWSLWNFSGPDKVQKADLDGSNRRDVLAGGGLYGVAVDRSAGKLYYTSESGAVGASVPAASPIGIAVGAAVLFCLTVAFYRRP